MFKKISTRLDFFSLSIYRFSDYNSLEMSEIKHKFIFGNFFSQSKNLKFVQIELWFNLASIFLLRLLLYPRWFKNIKEKGLKIIVVGILYLASEKNLKFVQIHLFSLSPFFDSPLISPLRWFKNKQSFLPFNLHD